ncbi:hypothetical protein [Rhizobium grahamii]|nr:hypothetical protein [Rhizobium grahamii]
MADTIVLTVHVFSTLCNETFKLWRAVFMDGRMPHLAMKNY